MKFWKLVSVTTALVLFIKSVNKEVVIKKSRLLGNVCAVIFILSLTSIAEASLLGDSIICNTDSPAVDCNPSPSVVGSGIEFTIVYQNEDHFYLDVSNSSITITASPIANPGIGWGFELSDLDWNGSGEIIGIENFFSNVGPLVPSDPRFLTGVIESDILIGEHSIYIDLSTSDWEAGDYVSFDLIGVSSVPVPPAIWLFGSGLIGLVGLAKRKKA